MKRVDLNSTSDGVGRKFTIISLCLAFGLNLFVITAWLIWTHNNGVGFLY